VRQHQLLTAVVANLGWRFPAISGFRDFGISGFRDFERYRD